MRPRLTRKLTLEERQRAPDGMGGFDGAWVALGTVWAELRPRSGREGDVGGLAAQRQPWRIVLRAAPAGAPSRPRADQRFREGARVFNILSVAEADADARYLICTAEEGLAP